MDKLGAMSQASDKESSRQPDNGTLRLSRSALYTLVWSKPMTEIAKLYGVRNDHVARACDQHDIPRPPTGYWQKLTHGKAVERAPLTTDKLPLESVVIIQRVRESAIGLSQ